MSHHQITVLPAGHQFAAENTETLLDAGLRQGLALPYGCRNGACGACKVKVISGTVQDYSEQGLTEAERAEGWVLACNAVAQSDAVLESFAARPAAAIPVKTLPARVERMEKVAADVMVLWLRLPASEQFQFLAGQYIDILLKDGLRRSFSLANSPAAALADGLLELHIREVPGGLFTSQVFSTMKVRDILRFEGPHGGFHLREDSKKPILLLAGGTGFAPIKAIVEQALHDAGKDGLPRDIAVYWGARDRSGLYLPELPAQWAAASPRLRYVPVLSAPTAADQWSGRTGLVHEAALADFTDLSGHQVYVCGAPVMVDAARRDCTSRAGLPPEEFFADAFTFNH